VVKHAVDDALIKKAQELFQSGISLADIARQLNVSPATVRSWKSRGKFGNVVTKRNVAKKRCNEKRVEQKMIQSVESNEELTDPQKAFCLHYVKTFNATMSYKRAYNCSYDTARVEGCRALKNPNIRNEITRLKRLRAEAILADPNDIVEKYMQIAFADITDYLDFGRATVPVMGPFGPLYEGKGKNKKPITREVNDVRFKESSEVDGTLLSEVKQGKDGASVKLADRMKALEWLSNYFEMNPMDKHRIEYENKKLEYEQKKLDANKPLQDVEDDPITASLKEELKK
jgi:phage terminase small subunit